MKKYTRKKTACANSSNMAAKGNILLIPEIFHMFLDVCPIVAQSGKSYQTKDR